MTRSARAPRAAIALAAAAALAACGTASAAPAVHRGHVVPVQAGSSTASEVAAAQTAFGMDLLHAVCGGSDKGNVLLSPTSAAEAMSLLYPAAGGQTATAMGKVLHLPAWSPALVAAMRDHTQALAGLRHDGSPRNAQAPDSVEMSNRLWTVSGLKPDSRYLDDIATAFAADLRSLDFARDPQGSTDRINATVAKDTSGKIARLFDRPLSAETVAVVTNAVHLKAHWAQPFTDTRPAPFTTASGTKNVPMMSGAAGTGRSGNGWQAVELPYRDGTLTAVAVLPPAGVDPCRIDATTLAGLASAPPKVVDVRLPRVKIEQTQQLLEPLKALGLQPQGDYPALGGSGLRLSQVVQKAFLDVDEQGTEAAAATGGVMQSSGRAPEFVVSFDRPFLILLTDTQTHSPLFSAVVHDPSV